MGLADRADVKVGFACNNRCVFCAQGEKRRQCGIVPPDQLALRLTGVRGVGRGLVLTGGEPTLHKNLVTLVRLARRLGFSPIQLQTNGRLLSHAPVMKALLAAGVSEVAPSLHGSTADIHDALTRAPGSWAESVAGIRNAVASRVRVITNSVIVRANLQDLPALVDLFGTLGVRQAQLAFVHPVGTAAQLFDQVVPRLQDVVEPVREAWRVARRLSMRLMTEAIPLCFLRDMEDLAAERAIPRTTVIDLDGDARDFTAWRTRDGKAHGPPCEACARAGACEGPWREYPERYGWGEFRAFG